jgi:hypothetical protein
MKVSVRPPSGRPSTGSGRTGQGEWGLREEAGFCSVCPEPVEGRRQGEGERLREAHVLRFTGHGEVRLCFSLVISMSPTFLPIPLPFPVPPAPVPSSARSCG